MFKAYYQLTKPGIIYGNLVTTIAGFFLASKGHINFWLLILTLVGISLVMAAGCVFNNILDQRIDARMNRTKNRATVTGQISNRNAIIYGLVLGLLGFVALWLHTNPLTTLIALVGGIVYIGLYTPLKPRSTHATLVGSIAGAVPPVVGYTAVTNRFDLGAILLFLVLVAWQMPHFYAIAIRRLDDYRLAGIPVLPAKKGILFTKISILVYIIVFIIATTLLKFFGYTGYVYLAVVGILGLVWLGLGIRGFRKNNNDIIWARQMFLWSLVVLMGFSIIIVITR